MLEVDGEPVRAWSDVQQAIREAAGRDLRPRGRARRRAGAPSSPSPAGPTSSRFDADGLPVLEEDGSYATVEGGFLGVAPTQDLVRQPVTVVPGQVADAVAGTARVVLRLPQYMVGVAEAAFGGGERDPEGPISVVGVGRLAGEIASFEDESGLIGLRQPRGLDPRRARRAQHRPVRASTSSRCCRWTAATSRAPCSRASASCGPGLRSLPDPGPVDVAKALPLAYGVALVLLGTSVVLIYADLVNPVRLVG